MISVIRNKSNLSYLIYSILFALLLGIGTGIISALKKNTYLDYIPMTSAMVGICVPSIILGPLLTLIFGIQNLVF